MKKQHPPGFKLVSGANCAACEHIQKVQKTKTAYCSKFGITYPIYESTQFYSCSEFQPVIGIAMNSEIGIKIVTVI